MKLIHHSFDTTFDIIDQPESKMNNEDFESEYNAFGMIIKDNQNRILIQKHNKFNLLTIPLGKSNIKEIVDIGIRKELEEECGIKANTLLKLDQGDLIFETESKNVIRMNTYLVEVLSYSGVVKNKEPHKHQFQKFMEIGEILKSDRLSYVTQLYLKNHL